MRITIIVDGVFLFKKLFLYHVWSPLEELKSLLKECEDPEEMLFDQESYDTITEKYHTYYNKAQQQKSELEEIKLRAEDYEKPYESVSKWITETDRALVKSKPLAAVPQLVKEQLDVIKVVYHSVMELCVSVSVGYRGRNDTTGWC